MPKGKSIEQYSISKLSSCFLYIVSLPIIIEIHFILKIWLGENIPEHTALFAVIVIVQSFVTNLNSAISGVVHASGKMKLYQLSGCLINLSALPLAYLALMTGVAGIYFVGLNKSEKALVEQYINKFVK